jgi:2,5-diketo-D-gluconate reductase A
MRKLQHVVPRIVLNDDTTVPQLGFGTSLVQPDAEPSDVNRDQTARIVGLAFDVGYRHVDTAQMYGNERGVGKAILASGIPRDELYVTSKLSNLNHHPDDVGRSYQQTLDDLGLDQLDLFLLHWPVPTLYGGDYVSTWRAIIELVADGRLRTAGVANFHPAHLDRIIDETGVVPAVNQIEMHPYFNNQAARAASLRYGIAVQAWSPLGFGSVIGDEVIGQIGAGYGKSSAQTILRWHVQRGHIVIPKSVHQARMEQNLNVFDFELSAEEMAAIDALDKGEAGRTGPNPETFDWMP